MSIAQRQWAAEEENSRRLGVRTNGTLAAIGAFGGLGFFNAKSFTCDGPLWLRLACSVGVLLAGACLGFAAVRLWNIRTPPRPSNEGGWSLHRKLLRWCRPDTRAATAEDEPANDPFASAQLLLHREPINVRDALRLRPDQIQGIEYYTVASAARVLHSKNLEFKDSLIEAQFWLVRGAVVAFVVAAVCLLRTSCVHATNDTSTSGGSDSAPTRTSHGEERERFEEGHERARFDERGIYPQIEERGGVRTHPCQG